MPLAPYVGPCVPPQGDQTPFNASLCLTLPGCKLHLSALFTLWKFRKCGDVTVVTWWHLVSQFAHLQIGPELLNVLWDLLRVPYPKVESSVKEKELNQRAGLGSCLIGRGQRAMQKFCSHEYAVTHFMENTWKVFPLPVCCSRGRSPGKHESCCWRSCVTSLRGSFIIKPRSRRDSRYNCV